MTRQEVHRFLYGNDNDVDEIILDEGFLGALKQHLHNDLMAIVPTNSVVDDNEIWEKVSHPCVLPYLFINLLAMYVRDDIDLYKYRVETVFDEICVFASNDGSIIYEGTIYELLLKVAQFTEVYRCDATSIPYQWLSVPLEDRIEAPCGDYGALFFDFETDDTSMTVFAPMTEDAFNHIPVTISVPPVAFALEVHYTDFNANQICSYFNQGIDIYGVETNTPADVLVKEAALSAYEINDLTGE